MKLILKQNVPNLGYKDDVVEVKDGYGRNYLIPQGLAVIASKAALKDLEESQKQRAHKIAQQRAEAEAFCKALEGTHLTIGAKASATGTTHSKKSAISLTAKSSTSPTPLKNSVLTLPLLNRTRTFAWR